MLLGILDTCAQAVEEPLRWGFCRQQCLSRYGLLWNLSLHGRPHSSRTASGEAGALSLSSASFFLYVFSPLSFAQDLEYEDGALALTIV